MPRTFMLLGAVFGFVGVGAGAFGAHALRRTVQAPERVATFQTGANYTLWHALALLATGIASAVLAGGELFFRLSGWCFALGIVGFSGSLFVLSVTGRRAWGRVTPVGGVLLLLGWAFLAIGLALAGERSFGGVFVGGG